MIRKVHNKAELLSRLLSNGERIRALGIKRICLFGSFARDTEIKASSDIDFVVDFKRGKKTVDNFFDLGFLLEDITGRKVDLITRESLKPPYGPKIINTLEDVRIG